MDRKAELSRADPTGSGDSSDPDMEKEQALPKPEVNQEDDIVWESMSQLSVSTCNVAFKPSKHCEERMRQRDIKPIDVQRAKKRGHKEELESVLRFTYKDLVVISDPDSGRDITTWATSTEAPLAETKALRVETQVSEEEGLGLSVRRTELDGDEGEKVCERMIVEGFRRAGTAFEKAGVRPGDVIIGVGSVDVSSQPYHKALKLIKREVASGQAAITFLTLAGYSIMIPEDKTWQFRGAFGHAVKMMSSLTWSLLPPCHGTSLHRLLVECTSPNALKEMEGLVECGKQEGFFWVPFRLEGQMRDERALRGIEERTGTRIRMVLNKDIQKIVVLVCPGDDGEVGRVGHAVKLIRELMTQPPKRKDVLGRSKTGPGYGGGRGGGGRSGSSGVR